MNIWKNKKTNSHNEEANFHEQMLDLIANSANEVFLMLDAEDFNVEYISPNTLRVLGIPDSVVEENVAMLGKALYENEDNVTYETLKEMKPDTKIVKESMRINKETGEKRWYTETIYRTKAGDKEKFMVVITDHTTEKRNKEILEEALEIAGVANDAKSSFLSNMSHDIRTPMNAIMGFCTLLKRDAEEPDKVRKYTKNISESSQHLLGIINNVLDMSKIESGNTALSLSEFSIAEVVDTIVEQIKPQVKSKNQVFNIFANDISKEYIIGDRLRVCQILYNLLTNAVKYTKEQGKISMTISQMSSSKENYVKYKFIIEDKGIGMSKEYMDVIFTPFTHDSNNQEEAAKGTGLGLAITKNLVDLMGGTINVKSEKDNGTIITVELMFKLFDTEENKAFWNKENIRHMLVIDSDVGAGKSISDSMSSCDVLVQVATRGESAVEQISEAIKQERSFDLILIEQQIAANDDMANPKNIRQLVDEDTIILLITANDWAADNDVEEWVDGVIQKPFFSTNLRRRIEKVRGLIPLEYEEEFSGEELLGMHFLAAEDNDLNAEIIKEILKMAGATCDIAKNGQEVVEKFSASKPGQYDMILMDIQMPVMNGYDASEAIRQSGHPDANDIPIVAMTANAFAEDVKKSHDAGMNAHVAKPVNLNQFKFTVKKLMKQTS